MPLICLQSGEISKQGEGESRDACDLIAAQIPVYKKRGWGWLARAAMRLSCNMISA